jgi:hypothetical protein
VWFPEVSSRNYFSPIKIFYVKFSKMFSQILFEIIALSKWREFTILTILIFLVSFIVMNFLLFFAILLGYLSLLAKREGGNV